MPQGFFPSSKLYSKEPPSTLMKCGACGLYKSCRTPKMPYSGEGKRRILVVAEAPGADEDDQGTQLIGKAGQELQRHFRLCGVQMRRDCWLDNAIICFVGDTRVRSPSPIRKVFRRDFTGTLVTVHSLSGRKLTGTPNHPILTSTGWLPLGEVKPGDYLICSDSSERSFNSWTDVNDPPASISQVFDSFSQSWNIKRMIGGRMDFHGDGEDGDVDVVISDGELWDGVETFVNEHLQEFHLPLTYHFSGGREGFGSSCQNAINFGQGSFTASNCVMGCRCDGTSPLGTKLLHADSHGVTAVSEVNSFIDENPSQFSLSDIEGGSEWLQSLPFHVSRDRIIKIELEGADDFVHRNSGSFGTCHVYNLETDGGYYIANGIIVKNCRPPNNRTPTSEEIDYCRPHITKTIEELQPTVIIPLGATAVQSVIRSFWRDDVGPITKWVGWQIPCQKLNAWICPTYHPSFLLRSMRKEFGRDGHPVLNRLFQDHLTAASRLKERPFKEPPDYKRQVKLILDPQKAARILRQWTREGGRFVFDYETTALRPEDGGAIVCCSVCWEGKRTMAYPWQEPARTATGELLKSRHPKLGWNIKFEDRWTQAEFGHPVRNWIWDGMVNTHVLDNRPGICSAKFQAFVNLGTEAYNEHIEQFLRVRGGRKVNQILQEVEVSDLLYYCGLDSLLEWQIVMKQMEKWNEVREEGEEDPSIRSR